MMNDIPKGSSNRHVERAVAAATDAMKDVDFDGALYTWVADALVAPSFSADVHGQRWGGAILPRPAAGRRLKLPAKHAESSKAATAAEAQHQAARRAIIGSNMSIII